MYEPATLTTPTRRATINRIASGSSGSTSAVGDHGHQRCVQNYIVGPGSANCGLSLLRRGSPLLYSQRTAVVRKGEDLPLVVCVRSGNSQSGKQSRYHQRTFHIPPPVHAPQCWILFQLLLPTSFSTPFFAFSAFEALCQLVWPQSLTSTSTS